MKKLIAIAVVFALVAGVAFAEISVSGEVFGLVNVIEGSSEKDSEITAGGEFKRIRLEGSGDVADGKFGGWIRVDALNAAFNQGTITGHSWEGEQARPFNASALAWWKPIDQLKVVIGGNPDGIWGKEGVTGWMFTQHVTDTGVVFAGDNVWGGSIYGVGLQFRNAFFAGYDSNGLALEIKPMDMLGINLYLPFISEADAGGQKAGNLYTQMVAQADVNLDFGNIAITMKGLGDKEGADLFVYFGLTAIENLGLDIGASFHINDADDKDKHPLFVGLGAKYSAGAFAVKFRTVFELPTDSDDKYIAALFDVLPYYAVNDNMRIYLSAGLGLIGLTDSDAIKNAADAKIVSSQVGWHINPYVEIGEEWGAKFYAGIKMKSNGLSVGASTKDDAIVTWSVPIAISLSF